MQSVRQGFLKRFVAAVIDGVILLVVGVVLGLVLGRLPYVLGVVSSLAGLAYMGLDVVHGQTVGKRVLNLKITAADGTPAAQGALLERYVIKNAASLVTLASAVSGLAFVGLFAGLVGLVALAGAFLMLRPDRLAGHDLLAGTAVYGPEAFEFMMPRFTEASAEIAG